jgi:hypothetical protein
MFFMTPKLDLNSGVIVPFAQAIGTGLLVGVTSSSFAHVLDWGDWLSWGVLGTTGGALLSWMLFRSEWAERFAAPKPAITQPAQSETLRVEIVARDPGGAFQAGVWLDLEIPRDRLERAARRALETGSFSHASLSGAHKPLSRSEFEHLRDSFVARGLASWKSAAGRSQGVELTASGRALLRRLAALPGETDPAS